MDTSDVVANAGNESVPHQLNVGMTLREARERAGMSVDDVAERIKFAPRQVEALESNDFARLPQATFLRGFVRSYARVLQLDETALLAALPVEQSKQAAPVQASGMSVSFPAAQTLPGINLLWLAGALGVALLLGMFAWWHEDVPESKPTELVVESVPLPSAESGVAPVVAASGPPSFSVPPLAGPANVAESRKAAEEPVGLKRPVVTAPPVTTAPAPAAGGKPAVPLEQLKRRPLHFVFSEDAWAEVIDVNGNILLSRTNPRGSEQWIGGPKRAPYEISIARPATVKLYYKGKEIDLSAYAGMETARLKVE